MMEPETGDIGEERKVKGDVTGSTVMGGGEERGAPGDPPQDSRDREADGRHPHEDGKGVACADTVPGDHCYCRHVDFPIKRYARVGKDAILHRIDKLDDTTSAILEDQAIFDNNLKSIRSHQGDYEAKLKTMLVQQQGVLHKTVKYLETGEDRMRELGRRAGVPTPVPVAGPDLLRAPASEVLLRQATTLRTAAEGLPTMEGSMEWASYGLPRANP